MTMKRGTRIEYRFAGGKIIGGKILRPDVMPDWFICRLTDEAGDFTACCHVDQIRNVSNR